MNKEELKIKKQQYKKEYRKSSHYKNLKKRWDRKYYLKNREKLIEKSKRYREKNKEYYKNYNKKYYEKNKEKIKERSKKYRESNKEKIRLYLKQYYKKNQDIRYEHYKKYKKNNPFLFKEIYTRYYAKKRNCKFIITQKQIQMIYQRDKMCVYCGSSKKLTLDHIIPVTKNGHTLFHNLVLACQSCNSSKNNRNVFEWCKEQGREVPIIVKKLLKEKQSQQKILIYL